MATKKKILVLIDWFLPGIKAGGPVKSVAAMVNKLSDSFEFYILTTDTDFGEDAPYKNITSNKWIDYSENTKVCYLSLSSLGAEALLKSINEIQPEIIYINSFFSKHFSILPLQLIRKNKINTKVILAPRGMLSEGALRIKPFKKKLFIRYSKITGLHKNLTWHSTKTDETNDIKKVFGNNVVICEAQNVSDIHPNKPIHPIEKKSGELKLVYLGRIAENKNLILILKALKNLDKGNVSLDVYGSMEDLSYWNECEKLIHVLPTTIKVSYKGMIAPEKIRDTFSHYHFLIQLSYSENFGHSIVEALSSSLPVIISNTTPWKNLDVNNAGWDVTIANEKPTVEALIKALALNNEEYSILSEGAYNYAVTNCQNIEVINKLKGLFS
ncbi:MAG: glycosyltransferase [Bacteroidota bacterium]|nr:glycosyltransferase [Bacteroidota bacterium]